MQRSSQRDLFGGPTLLAGVEYVEDFIDAAEEQALLEAIAALPLQYSQYRQFTAKRRTVSYGFGYDFTHNALHPAPPLPEFLFSLRERVARHAHVSAAAFEQALVTEYQIGTTLGWHRDVPQFDVVAGISLANPTRMRLRAYPPRINRREGVIALELQPRSLYLFRKEARWGWQHSIPPTKTLRYSITFRTLRRAFLAEGAR